MHAPFTLATSPDVHSLRDVRWVMIDLHGGEEIPAEIDAVIRPEKRAELEAALQRDKDTGATETIQALLQTRPGGLAVHVRCPRLLVDLNRDFSDDPHAPGRHSLAGLSEWADLSGAAGQRAIWTAAWHHAAIRGRTGILTTLSRALPATVPFWDFHTYDTHSPDGSLRPQVQLFSDFNGEAFIPLDLCEKVRALLDGQPGALRIPAAEVGIDEPYAMFDGCLLPTLKGRPLLATEVRKDLFGPDWAAGASTTRGIARTAAMMGRVIDALIEEGLTRFAMIRPPAVPHC